MKKLIIAAVIILIFVLLKATLFTSKSHEQVSLGKWNAETIDTMLATINENDNVAEKIDYISSAFSGNNYKASTLIGDQNTEEVFVVDLENVDCFTFIDYVTALSISNSFEDFKNNLKQIRYQDSKVDFTKRNHFFSDWAVYNSRLIKDATQEVAGDKALRVSKKLNAKNDNDVFLTGIEVQERDIWYIPSSEINESILSKIQNGDFIGLYSTHPGLDVSHVGIAIKRGNKVYYRNASSKKKNMKVVDEDLQKLLIEDKYPGIVVLRQYN